MIIVVMVLVGVGVNFVQTYRSQRTARPTLGMRIPPLRGSSYLGPDRADTSPAMAPAHVLCSVQHAPRLVVLTGGPGGGKTAVLEIVRKHFGEHVVVLPEAATIIFRGGFPRESSGAARRAAQRAIYQVEVELETMAIEEARAPVVLCDRGTIDGVAYWPDAPETFWPILGTTREAELARYATVIHLRTPPADGGYNHSNRLRFESAREAALIDERIAAAWCGHPRRFFIDSEREFMLKAAHALELIGSEINVSGGSTHPAEPTPRVSGERG
jgi:predicted ATPase